MNKLFNKRKFNRGQLDEVHDYVFAYEDKTKREEAKRGLSFVDPDYYSPSKTLKGDTFFEFAPAFEFTGNSIWDTGTDNSPQYKTIFTYSELPFTGHVLVDHENPLGTNSRTVSSSGLSFLVRALSAVLLVLLFPFLCWIFVKYISRNERLIVFRLGARLKPKGPGFVLLLPFCDQYHLVRLDDQKMNVHPVSGGTEDEAIVELHCSLTYRLLDPDYAFVSSKEPPSKIVDTQAQLCLLAALSRLSWKQLNDGGARQDLVAEAMSSLNLRCGAHGIIVSQMEISELHLLRACPSPNTTKKMSSVQKHLKVLSAAFLHHTPAPSAVSKQSEETKDALNEMTADLSKTEQHDVPIRPSLTEVTDLQSSISARDVCTQAIARSQPFLNNQLACRALGRTTMQLFVSTTKITEPLPNATTAMADNNFTLMYLDSKNGRADYGPLPSSELPSVQLYITASNLMDVLNGRLNLMEAINDKIAFVTGDTAVFHKLRHLLYLKPG